MDYFDVTAKILQLGEKMEVGFMQHMKIPWKTTGYQHHVSLGGTFEHSQKTQGDLPNNILTVGGSWQISGLFSPFSFVHLFNLIERELIKGKVNTLGLVSGLYGVRLGSYPSATVSFGVDWDLPKHKWQAGISILVED